MGNQFIINFFQFKISLELNTSLSVRIIRSFLSRESNLGIDMPHIMRFASILDDPWWNALRVSNMCLIKMKNDGFHVISPMIDVLGM